MHSGTGASLFLILVGSGLHKIITSKPDRYESDKELIENFPYPAAIVLPDQSIDHCNQKLIDLLGYELWELKEKKFGEYTHARYREKDEHLFEDVIDPRKALDNYKMTKAWYHKKGSLVWGHMTVIPVMNPKHEVLYTIAWVKPTKEELDEVKTVIVESRDNIVIQALKEFSKSASPLKLTAAITGFLVGLAILWNFGQILEIIEKIFTTAP